MAVSDRTLVLGTLGGDDSAFGELYDRYAGLIRAICNDTTREVNEAQDLAQEVFLRAYARLERLKDPEKFGAWLVSMARNVCREYRRGRFRDRHVLVGLEPSEKEHDREKEQDERLDYLQEAMAQLNDRERLALHVYYLQEQDVNEAKDILGMSRSAFYRLLTKARKKIEKFIGSKMT